MITKYQWNLGGESVASKIHSFETYDLFDDNLYYEFLQHVGHAQELPENSTSLTENNWQKNPTAFGNSNIRIDNVIMVCTPFYSGTVIDSWT